MIKSLFRLLPLELLYLIVITIFTVLAGYILGSAIVMILYGVNTVMEIAQLNLSDPNAVKGLWILQIVSTTIPILASAVFFAKFVVKDTDEYLKTSFKFPWFLLVIVFCAMLVSAPLIEMLGNINQKLELPHFLAGLQQWMRNTEDNAQKLTTVLLQMKTVSSMIFKLLVVGLLTAVVEEFMFRGCMQTIFMKWTKNAHAAVWITAVLFSAFHLEFFGFLPRLMLGALFGYFVVWSGSIWTSVWAHFINNGTAVIWSYLYQNKMSDLDPDNTHLFNLPVYLFSLIIILFLLYLYRNIAMGKWKMPAK
ncbi:CPBP family intramembrane glutamic endopeptidase [Mucilaginibacter sp. dw_454]|uniref:CPBP family intramembrane glutamic endopeptidase n=1 Tax=Mucilaginibacter sp. dw_454 TaxID=2720079 RepID=UPI001BD2DC9C|nr:CPBP family intramembrane glutamic endopeptidase [Mucilaginibacter sp. dw_454]